MDYNNSTLKLGYLSINSDLRDVSPLKKVVIINIYSGFGMGNQFFRYAAGFALAERLNNS